MLDDNLLLFRVPKGAPLAVLLAMGYSAGRPVTRHWIMQVTCYSDKTVRQALAQLLEFGFVIRVEAGWSLSDISIQLLSRLAQPSLPAGQACKQDQPESETALSEIQRAEPAEQDVDPGDPDPVDPGGNFFSPPISINNKAFKDSLKLNNTNNGENFSTPLQNYSDDPELGEALLAAGIRENERTRRLLGRISVRDVRSMINKVRQDPMHDLSETGLMITILEGMAERNQRQSGYESWNT